MGDRLKGLVAEGSIWMSANLICSAAALLVTYVAVTMTGGGHAKLATALTVAGVVSLPWGSWISLAWTEAYPLRAAMKGITLVPGLMLLSAGGIGFYVGLGSILYWMILIASAIGTLAVTVLLWRSMPRTAARPRARDSYFGTIILTDCRRRPRATARSNERSRSLLTHLDPDRSVLGSS